MKPDENLLELAKLAWDHAYAPYSKFKVGAALKTDSGQTYSGANIENASFGLTRCGEQSAIQAMASKGERKFSEIVIYTEAEDPATPCGACRQILYEFSPEASVYLVNHLGTIKHYKVSDLLPDAFWL